MGLKRQPARKAKASPARAKARAAAAKPKQATAPQNLRVANKSKDAQKPVAKASTSKPARRGRTIEEPTPAKTKATSPRRLRSSPQKDNSKNTAKSNTPPRLMKASRAQKRYATPAQAYPSPTSPTKSEGIPVPTPVFQPLNLRSLSLQSLPIQSILGHGGFGIVYKSEHNGTPLAVKKFKLSHSASTKISPSESFQEQEKAFKDELEAFKKVGRHAHCVDFYGYGIDKKNKEFAIVLEFAPHGSLNDIVAATGKKKIRPQLFLPVLKQIVSGIKHLHDHNMVHRDIKPDNVLVYELDPPLVKISDFGLLRKQEQEITKLRTFAGTPYFLPPELDWTSAEEGKSFKAKKTVDFYAADIWALGILITEIVTAGCLSSNQLGMLSRAAREDDGTSNSRYSLRNVTREVLLKSGVGKCPPWVADLVEQCLQKRPAKRPRIGEIQDILNEH